MITTSEFAECAGVYPVLRDLTSEEKQRFASNSHRTAARAGRTLFDVGTECRAYPLLLGGSIRVTRFLSDGREIVVYRLRPGEGCVLSTSCLLGNLPYPARGLVEQDLHGIMLSKGAFQSLVQTSGPFREFVLQSFADRTLQLIDLIELLGFGQLDQRLAHTLRDRPNVIESTHEQLAQEVGSVREVVSRVLKRFEHQGVLHLARGKITIVDRQALDRIARPYGDSSH
jgi:CRP/FNR family transcriptional regulator